MNILISNKFLNEYTGSELAAFDIAKTLMKDHEVHLAASKINHPLLSDIIKAGIPYIDLENKNHKEKDFDLLIGNHLGSTLPIMARKGYRFKKIIAFTLSPFEPAENLKWYYKFFNKIYANSDETQQVRSINSKLEIDIFYNSITEEFLDYKKHHNKELKNLLIVGNRKLSDKEIFASKMQKLGINIKFFGKGESSYKMICPEDLLNHDAILTIGRTVQYCLGLKIPVYCYGRFGGPGWITPDNFEENKQMNFSGRTHVLTHREVTSREIKEIDYDHLINEIVQNYNTALDGVDILHEKCKAHFNLKKNIEAALEAIYTQPDISSTKLTAFLLLDQSIRRILKTLIRLIPIKKIRRELRNKYE